MKKVPEKLLRIIFICIANQMVFILKTNYCRRKTFNHKKNYIKNKKNKIFMSEMSVTTRSQ
jgi:hypothetical protein